MRKSANTPARTNAALMEEASLALRSMACIAGELIEQASDERMQEMLHAIRFMGDGMAEKLAKEAS